MQNTNDLSLLNYVPKLVIDEMNNTINISPTEGEVKRVVFELNKRVLVGLMGSLGMPIRSIRYT